MVYVYLYVHVCVYLCAGVCECVCARPYVRLYLASISILSLLTAKSTICFLSQIGASIPCPPAGLFDVHKCGINLIRSSFLSFYCFVSRVGETDRVNLADRHTEQEKDGGRNVLKTRVRVSAFLNCFAS